MDRIKTFDKDYGCITIGWRKKYIRCTSPDNGLSKCRQQVTINKYQFNYNFQKVVQYQKNIAMIFKAIDNYI